MSQDSVFVLNGRRELSFPSQLSAGALLADRQKAWLTNHTTETTGSPTTALLACSVLLDKSQCCYHLLIVSRLWHPQELEELTAGSSWPRFPQTSCLYKYKLHIETKEELILSLRGRAGIPASLLHLMVQALPIIPHYFSIESKTCDDYNLILVALNCGY